MARRSVGRKVQIAALAAHGYKCYYCGTRATEAEHVVPANYGGTDAFENLLGLGDLS